MTLTGAAFLLAFFVGLGTALFRYPIVGLYTYIAVWYLHPPSRWWGATLPDLRWSFLAAGVTLLAIWLHAPRQPGRQPWFATTPGKVMTLFTLWFWVVSLWALDLSLHIPAAILVTKYVMVFYMVYRLVDTPAKVNAFLLVHITGCLYLGWLAYGVGAPDGRLDGVGGPGIDDSNTLGMHLATGVVVGAMLMLQSTGWRLGLCVVAIAFSLNALVLTGTRGAVIALVCAGLTLVYVKPRAYRGMFYLYGVLGALLLTYVASERFWDRMATTKAVASGKEDEMDFSAYSRIAMFNAQIEMAESYPLGSGQRGSEVLSSKYLAAKYLTATGARSSHNTFMTVLVEQGIPGAILFAMMVGWTANTLRKVARTGHAAQNTMRNVHAAAIGGALTVVFIGGMFADFAQVEVQIWMFALLAALIQPTMQTTSMAPVGLSEPAGQRVLEPS
jgi:O-antigen ligase